MEQIKQKYFVIITVFCLLSIFFHSCYSVPKFVHSSLSLEYKVSSSEFKELDVLIYSDFSGEKHYFTKVQLPFAVVIKTADFIPSADPLIYNQYFGVEAIVNKENNRNGGVVRTAATISPSGHSSSGEKTYGPDMPIDQWATASVYDNY